MAPEDRREMALEEVWLLVFSHQGCHETKFESSLLPGQQKIIIASRIDRPVDEDCSTR
jgi:hypothetical protein